MRFFKKVKENIVNINFCYCCGSILSNKMFPVFNKTVTRVIGYQCEKCLMDPDNEFGASRWFNNIN